MDGPPPPRRYSRGAYDDDRRPGPPPVYRDAPAYDRPPPPIRGPGRRDDYYDDRAPPIRPYDDALGGPPPPGFDGRRVDSPDYEARKRRRSPSPGGPLGPPRGGRPSMDYPPREYRDGPPPPPGHYRDEYYDRRGPPPRGGPRYSGPPPPLLPQAYPPPAAGVHGEPFPVQPSPPHRPALEPPMQLPHRVSHAYFSDWFQSTNPPSLADSAEALEDAYKKYTADFAKRELRRLFATTRDFGGEWFAEKYGTGAERERERAERRDKAERRRRVAEWADKADKGELDGLTFDFDEELARKPRIQPNAATQAAAAGTNGASASPEQARVELPPATSPAPSSTMTPGPIALKASSPEFVVLPARPDTLALQGVPPTVKYKELEALLATFPGFTRLALGEPQPHNAFIRAGWAVFSSAEDAAAALATVHAATPAPAPAEGKKDDGEDQPAPVPPEVRDEEMKDAAEPAAIAAADESTGEAEAPKTDDLAPESPFVLAASTPLPYDLRAPGAVLALLEAREVRVRATPAALSAPVRVALDCAAALRVVDEMERRLFLRDGDVREGRRGGEVIRAKREAWEKEVEERKERDELDAEAHQAALASVAKRTLDLAIAYLRDAHDVCFYCCAVCESPEQLAENCAKHVRRCDVVKHALREADELNWVQGFDAHLPLLQDLSGVDVRDLGAESREEELYRLTSPHLKQEEEGKFRCKTCNKLFSARKFVEKHIGIKHADLFGDALDEIAVFNNYALDPNRLPLQQFQRENYLPSILNPPPPPPAPGRRPHLADRIGPPHKRSRRDRGGAPRDSDGGAGGGAPANPAPPPKGAALDPRAQRGATAYADLDGPAGGADTVVLPY